MSIEHIISKIQQDAREKTEQVLQEAEKEAEAIRLQIKQDAEAAANRIIEQAKQEAQQKTQITIAQVHQEMKRNIMAQQEQIITTCFENAQEKLSTLSDNEYSDIVTRLIQNGTQKLGKKSTVYITKQEDKKIATTLGVSVSGSVQASGGVVLRSADGKISLDNTFEGILRRKKDGIRVAVGKLLFSCNGE